MYHFTVPSSRDTAGQERFKTLTNVYFRGAAVSNRSAMMQAIELFHTVYNQDRIVQKFIYLFKLIITINLWLKHYKSAKKMYIQNWWNSFTHVNYSIRVPLWYMISQIERVLKMFRAGWKTYHQLSSLLFYVINILINHLCIS